MRKLLIDLARVVADEVERNPDFAQRVSSALGHMDKPSSPNAGERDRRPRNRRAPALFDPVELARQSDSVLRSRLAELTVEQLKDIVSEYGMDPGKVVTNWKDAARIAERIVEVAIARATKGDAFR